MPAFPSSATSNLQLWTLVFLLALLTACDPIAGKSTKTLKEKQNSVEKIKAGSQTELKQETGQPLIVVSGELSDSPITVTVPELPSDRIEGNQTKKLENDSMWSMTFDQAWSKVSGWFWPLFALAMLVLYYIYSQSGAKAVVHGVHQSMKGGLRAFGSVRDIFNHSLHGIDNDEVKAEVRRIFDQIKSKESSLKAKAPNGDFKGRGHLS